jgi:hypothetical protein
VDCDPVAPEVVDFEVEEKDKKEAQISPQDSESILNGVARLVQAITSFSYIRCTVVTVYSCYMWGCSYRST